MHAPRDARNITISGGALPPSRIRTKTNRFSASDASASAGEENAEIFNRDHGNCVATERILHSSRIRFALEFVN